MLFKNIYLQVEDMSIDFYEFIDNETSIQNSVKGHFNEISQIKFN
jgi:hypothetical protein